MGKSFLRYVEEVEAMLGMITWRPGIGDPTVVGWVTTIGYGVASALCARAGRRASANDECRMTNDEGMELRRAECGTNNEETKERRGSVGDGSQRSEISGQGDGEHPTSNFEHGTTNIGIGNAERGGRNEELPQKGIRNKKDFRTANDTKDANRVNVNEIPAGAPEGTTGAVVVPEVELNNEGTGANDECPMTNDEGDGEHRTLNIQHRTSNGGTGNPECGTNNEATKERRSTTRDRGQGSEVGCQMSEVRDQKSNVRDQGSEVRDQKSNVRDQGSEVRDQMSDVRCQKSEFRVKKVEGRGQKAEVGSQNAEGGDQKAEGEEEARVWFGLALGLLFLGTNKQLDLQTLLIQIGREIAVSQGWFEERRQIQFVFLIIAVFAGGLGMIGLGWKCRQFLRNHPMLLVGIGLLGFYVLLRSASIDHVENAMGFVIPDEAGRLASIELGGILCLAYEAAKVEKTK